MKSILSGRRILVLAICLFIATAILFSSTVGAYTVAQSFSASGVFKSPWTLSKTTWFQYGGRDILTYGYNTTFINEDFAYSYSDCAVHRAAIKNGNGTHYAGWYYANYYSDLEVRHKGNTVYYYTHHN